MARVAREPGARRRSGPYGRLRPPLLACLALLLAGAAFWAVFWQQSADSALTRVPLLDELLYLQEGARLRAEGPPGREPFVVSPGYTLLVAVAADATVDERGYLPEHPRLLLLWQALAWLGCGLAIGVVVHRFGAGQGSGPGATLAVAVLAALLFLLYRPGAVLARCVLLETTQTLLTIAALAVVAGRRRPTWRRALLAGALLGAAALLRAQVLILLPLMVWSWWPARGARPQAAVLVVLAATTLLPPALASWHNSRLCGRFCGPSLNAGLNLYLGQLPVGRGLFPSLQGFDPVSRPAGEDYLAARMGRRVTDAGAADAAWMGEALRLAAADPWRAAGGWLRKVWLHLQAWDVAQVTPLGSWPREAPVLGLLVVPWWLLVVLGLGGAAAGLRRPRGGDRDPCGGDPRRRTVRFWLLAALLLIAVQSLFFVVGRYRLVLAPILAVLAGCGALSWPGGLRSGRWRSAGAAALVLSAIAAATVPWGLGEIRRQWSALESWQHARRSLVLAEAVADPAERSRLLAASEDLLAAAAASAARHQDVWLLRAHGLTLQGRPDHAVAVLAEGIARADEVGTLRRQRYVLLREMGRLDAAEAELRALLRDEPEAADQWHDLAVLLGRLGRWSATADAARRLQEVAPDDHRGWLDLGVALARLGRRQEAAAVFREGWRAFDRQEIRNLFAANLLRLEEPVPAP